MVTDSAAEPRRRSIALPGRGEGEMAFLDLGPPDRAVDAVFMHANGFNALTYRRILGPLAARYRILAADHRGHGWSTLEINLDARRDWLDLRDDLLAFLEALELSRVVLSGHSMGGTTALLAAAADEACCRGLVLLDPVILPPDIARPPPEDSPLIEGAKRRRAVFPSREEAVKAYRGRGAFRTWPESILTDYVEAGFRDLETGEVTLSCSPAWEASGFTSQGHDPWEALGRCHCPIEVLRAETGSTFHVGHAAELARGRFHMATVPGSSHFLPMERPDLVRDALAAAIEGEPAAMAKGG